MKKWPELVKVFILACILSAVGILINSPFKTEDSRRDVVLAAEEEVLDKLYSVREEKEFKLDIVTGLKIPLEEEKIYYSVIIDNISYARPQYGLSLAPLVYELPAEGGITRFLAIFDSTEMERIGPVRSARPYFIDKASEHGLLLVHCGGSPDALSIIANTKYPDMDELRNGSYFFRDKTRSAPYNLFVTPENIVKYAGVRNYSLDSINTGFDFVESISEDESSDGLSWKCVYTSTYNVLWEYSAETNRYTRYIRDQVHMDELTQEPITAANVVIQYISYKVLDSAGRLQLSSKNEGSGAVLTSGHVIECKWEMTDNGTIEYFDMEGNKVKFTPGNTWIQTLMESEDVRTTIPILREQ